MVYNLDKIGKRLHSLDNIISYQRYNLKNVFFRYVISPYFSVPKSKIFFNWGLGFEEKSWAILKEFLFQNSSLNPLLVYQFIWAHSFCCVFAYLVEGYVNFPYSLIFSQLL